MHALAGLIVLPDNETRPSPLAGSCLSIAEPGPTYSGAGTSGSHTALALVPPRSSVTVAF